MAARKRKPTGIRFKKTTIIRSAIALVCAYHRQPMLSDPLIVIAIDYITAKLPPTMMQRLLRSPTGQPHLEVSESRTMTGGPIKLPIKASERPYAAFMRHMTEADPAPKPAPLAPETRVTRDAIATLAGIIDSLARMEVAVLGHLPETVRLKLSRLILAAAEKAETAQSGRPQPNFNAVPSRYHPARDDGW